MSDRIGVAAGEVWGYLKENGASTAARIQKGIGKDAALTHQAIGWLAREGKLRIDRTRKVPTFDLCE
jgi:hypothetical protein